MIDTIRWKLFGNTHGINVRDLDRSWTVHEGRRFRRASDDPDDPNLPMENLRLVHEESGMRLQGTGNLSAGVVDTVEVSLPRLLFGQNGRIIADQKQLDESICLLRKSVRELLGEEHGMITEAHLTRVDLVWQYRRDPRKMIDDLEKIRHPQVRKANRVFEGESVNFPGKERYLRIYDKEKEQKGRRGDVTRIELQLRGRALKDDLGGQDRVSIGDLKWDACYRAYRAFLMRFEPIRRIDLRKTVELLAWAVRNEARGKDGQMMFDLWAEGKSPSYIRQVTSKISRLNFHYRQWTFGDLLPEDPKSDALEVVEVA